VGKSDNVIPSNLIKFMSEFFQLDNHPICTKKKNDCAKCLNDTEETPHYQFNKNFTHHFSSSVVVYIYTSEFFFPFRMINERFML
jgi:hypothetical protein